MKKQFVLSLCAIIIFLFGCDGEHELHLTIDEAFAIFSEYYGVHKPENIKNGKIYVYRFEWLETSDTYFMKFFISPEEFKKLEESADHIIYKVRISQDTNSRWEQHNAPGWFKSKIEDGFRTVLSFNKNKVSNKTEIGDTLTLQITIDDSNKSEYIVYLTCNRIVKW